MLREAVKGKGNFGIGSATVDQAEALGRAWVGDGYTVASDGLTLLSKDGLRQFRPPSVKPKLGKVQANLEWRVKNNGEWQGNAHIDIEP
jgi:filamentous hemagglutinin